MVAITVLSVLKRMVVVVIVVTLEVVAVVFKYFCTVSVASVVCDILHQESASAQASHCALITLSLS